MLLEVREEQLGSKDPHSAPVTSMFQDDEPEEDDVFGDHSWHYRYNRRLSCFQNPVSSLTFSQDGQYLVSGTGSGDVKIWDTGVWAEAARLKHCSKEEPRALAISPAQRWLVCCHSSILNVYTCQKPWRLEFSMPAPLDVATKAKSEWCCIAFSPMSEVDHPGGHAGQDNHLAAFASKSLCVFDYSGGWSSETPKRTRSVFNSAKPTSIAYTACGWWLVCGYECGELQIWNHFSLTLEKTLSAHNGMVHGITASPRCAPYDARFVSCGLDRSLRVWHSAGWCLEQIVPDTKADRNGIRCCTFSSTGNWVVSVAFELCIWSVCVSSKGRMELRLHQRLEAVCGAEGLMTAAFCVRQDAIAVGSRDGVLGLWTKIPGKPTEPLKETAGRMPRVKGSSSGVTAWIMDRPLARPMMHVTPEGNSTIAIDDRRPLAASEWFVRSDLRSLSRTASVCYGSYKGRGDLEKGSKPSPVTPNIRAKLMASRDRVRKAALHDVGEVDDIEVSSLDKSSSMPELKRWKPSGYEYNDVLSMYCNATTKIVKPGTPSNDKFLSRTMPGGFRCNSSQGNRRGDSDDSPTAMSTDISALRKSMMKRSADIIVRRISLDPQSIV